MALAITQDLAEKDPLVLRLLGAMRLAISERSVPRKIFVHRDIGVQPKLDEATPTGFGFSVRHELPPNAAPLHRWCDRDRIDEHMVLVGDEDENAGDRAVDLEHIDEVVLDARYIIVDHRFRSSTM